jgi:uncharacterized membrane protein
MASKNKKAKESKTEPKMPNPNHTHGAEAGAFAGEVVGGVVGSMAGPPGAIAGMLMGAAAGALAGMVIDRDAERTHVHDDELDKEIGVTSDELGAPNLEHPPESSRR